MHFHGSHGEMVGVELLLVAQGIEVGFDGQRHNRRRAVSQVLFERFRLYGCGHGGYGWTAVVLI